MDIELTMLNLIQPSMSLALKTSFAGAPRRSKVEVAQLRLTPLEKPSLMPLRNLVVVARL